ncbi:MAG TPA: DUF3237 domain-containing protein, partial [Franconibacter helveticus]|nr:DUF3237 domain-containing protein [Franconibacter helveticus]
DMRFFNQLSAEDIYFRTAPVFEVSAPELDWLTNSLFVCSANRTASGVKLAFYRVV